MSQLTAVDISDSDRFELAEVLKEESESSSAPRLLEPQKPIKPSELKLTASRPFHWPGQSIFRYALRMPPSGFILQQRLSSLRHDSAHSRAIYPCRASTSSPNRLLDLATADGAMAVEMGAVLPLIVAASVAKPDRPCEVMRFAILAADISARLHVNLVG